MPRWLQCCASWKEISSSFVVVWSHLQWEIGSSWKNKSQLSIVWIRRNNKVRHNKRKCDYQSKMPLRSSLLFLFFNLNPCNNFHLFRPERIFSREGSVVSGFYSSTFKEANALPIFVSTVSFFFGSSYLFSSTSIFSVFVGLKLLKCSFSISLTFSM